MKKTLYIAILPALVLFSCNKDNNANSEEQQVVEFTAVNGNEDTKTALTEPYSGVYQMSWSSGEEVTLFAFPKTWPAGDENTTYGLKSWISWVKWSTFENVYGSGISARFAKQSGNIESFETGDRYVITYPRVDAAYVDAHYTYSNPNLTNEPSNYLVNNLNREDPGSSSVDYVSFRLPFYEYQTYNPGNNLGLSNNIIPMFGIIEKGAGTGFEPTAVKMQTPAAIIKLVLNNTSSSDKNIDKITLTDHSSNPTNTGIAGLARIKVSSADNSWIHESPMVAYRTEAHTITLDCLDTKIDKLTGSKVFSFVIIGDHATYNLNTLTWDIYETGKVSASYQTTSDYSKYVDWDNPGKRILSGKVYTKTYNITD